MQQAQQAQAHQAMQMQAMQAQQQLTAQQQMYEAQAMHQRRAAMMQQQQMMGGQHAMQMQMEAQQHAMAQQQMAAQMGAAGFAQEQAANQPPPPAFDHAISYVTKIRQRFRENDHENGTYKHFLDILHTYQEGVNTIKTVLDKVATLFRDHPDLLREFTYFLPESAQPEAQQVLEKHARRSEMAMASRGYGNGAGGYGMGGYGGGMHRGVVEAETLEPRESSFFRDMKHTLGGSGSPKYDEFLKVRSRVLHFFCLQYSFVYSSFFSFPFPLQSASRSTRARCSRSPRCSPSCGTCSKTRRRKRSITAGVAAPARRTISSSASRTSSPSEACCRTPSSGRGSRPR